MAHGPTQPIRADGGSGASRDDAANLPPGRPCRHRCRSPRSTDLPVGHACAHGPLSVGFKPHITAGLVTPEILLVGTLVIGCGAALTMPAWQAAVSTLVEPGQIHSAAALNRMSFNFARAVGPALAGFIAQAATIATIFWINAVSFLGLILVFWRWRTGSARIRATKSEPPCEATAMGFSGMLSNSRFRSLLVRTFICFFGASSMWSLLPAFAALHLQMEAAEVGLLMGTIGVGAVLGGALLPRLKGKIGLNRLITVASTQLGLALLLAA
ncbi:MFS transporter [Sinorhizobium meliloti]|nr:MFS transporter [Sinorhizobium meliloti]